MLLRVLLLIFAMTASAAMAEGRRVALVIGNDRYAAIQPLANPGNDARLVADALRKVGFTVDQRSDLDLAHFRQALRDFRGQADGAEVALIYYAGHGVEEDGQNWLVPTDAELAGSKDLQYEAIDLDLLMTTLAGARMRVAVLDACRNNPFKAAKPSSGLAQVEVDDVLVIFAAAPGRPAEDGNGTNSPFATALARRIPQPGIALQNLGGVVRDDVIAITDSKQRPFISASVTGNLYYLTGDGSNTRAAFPAPSAVAAEAVESWVARAPRLPISEVNVTRTATDDTYNYTVSGIYPTTRRNGTPAPQARLLRIVPRRIVHGRALAFRQARQSKIGIWNPGDPFKTTFRLPKTEVDRAPDFELRLCIGEGAQGDAGFCFWSPNLVQGGNQRLWPSGTTQPRRGIAPRRTGD